MGLPRDNQLCPQSKYLKINMTETEKRLWYKFFRDYPFLFRPQKIIGPYIVDFFCNKVRLSIELDGSQHYEPEYIKKDRIRTNYLEMLEVKELRFPNSAVWENIEGVGEVIHREVQLRRNDLVTIPLAKVISKR